MKYIFGPVPSRRLGFSLGVDLLPPKTCNMDCVYCELGRTKEKSLSAPSSPPWQDVFNEIQEYVSQGRGFDCLTLTASGEPTLYEDLYPLIYNIKKFIEKPVTVLTNSSTADQEQVRKALCMADLVLPSLDAATQQTFRKINRPHPALDIMKIIQGLATLRREMKGKMWLEILFVRGINDTEEELKALKEAVSTINPHKIQLNTVVRPPAESWASPISSKKMAEIKAFFGEKAEIVIDFEAQMRKGVGLILESEIVDTLKRRPLTPQDLEGLFGEYKDTNKVLNRLLHQGVVKKKQIHNRTFYVAETGAA
ncbi:MAG: radical SAM protein [Thermodesulfobacteria bacterium]|nr:radical SAM protein [Thermodesulfobacteriota bacterium]